jgi:hypothetical protein
VLTLVSGYSIPLRAKIIRRLDELESGGAQPHINGARKEAFELQMIGIKYLAEMLHYSEPSKLEMIHSVHNYHGVSTYCLPTYTKAVQVTFSASDLLKKNNCGISIRAFNDLMMANGFLEEKERTASKGQTKKFKSLTENGLKYGQNDASKHNPRETQPHYFENTFMDLFSILTAEEEVTD